jgi:two-component sensor histidine kinase
MVAVELATNAVKHTASGRGGSFAVEITWHAQPTTVRIGVADGGGPTGPQRSSGHDLLSEHGRGLQVVLGLASRTGACGDEGGRLIWADIPWTDRSPVGSRSHTSRRSPR